MKQIKIEIKKQMANHAVGDIVELNADDNGVPLDFHWRRRLKDAEIDGCCEVVKSVAKKQAFTPSTRHDDAEGEE